jgi:outer membrane lipoprotein SlyB
MEQPNTPARPRLHPLVATAAISVIVLSAVGVTALVMNHSSAQSSPYDAPPPTAAYSAPAPIAPPAQASSQVSQPVSQAAPEPAPLVATAPTPYAAPTVSHAQPATPVYDQPQRVAEVAPPVCHNCGVVDSIRDIKVKGEGTGVGAVGGAVVGGLLGNMVGSGRGKALATVAGAVGGGFGGNAIEKNVRSEVEHRMVVRLDGGGTRTFTQSSPFPYREGERVRVVNGHVERG